MKSMNEARHPPLNLAPSRSPQPRPALAQLPLRRLPPSQACYFESPHRRSRENVRGLEKPSSLPGIRLEQSFVYRTYRG